MAKVAVDLTGRDNLSPALRTASSRLAELRTQIEQLRAKGSVNLTVADTKNLTKLTSEANRLEKALGGVGAAGQRMGGQLGSLQGVLGNLGLGSLAGLATGAGLAAAAVQVGKTTIELGRLGAQSLVTRDSFASVMASIGASPALLNDLNTAAGGTITQMRLMQLANTAVAGASEELGGAFAAALPKLIEGARAANQLNPALGDTEFLFNSLVTGIKRGSPMLIDNTGITLKLGEANEAYAASLGKSAAALTEEEKKLALLQATMDGVDRLVQQAGGNLDNLTTSTQQLTTAWQNLKTAIGEGLAPMVSEAQSGVAAFMSELAASIQAGSSDAQVALIGLQSELRFAQADLEALEAQPLDPNGEFGEVIAQSIILKARIADLEEQIGLLTPQVVGLGVAGAGAANAVMSALGAAAQAATTINPYYVPSELDQAEPFMWSADMGWIEEFKLASDKIAEQQNAALNRANKAAADDYTRQMQAAFDKLATDVQSKLGGAIQASIGLADLTGGDIFAPGSNGPFEAIYRAQAVAVGGIENADEQRWAEMYGLTPETAAKIVADFQKGLFTADVQKLIDVDALVGQIQGEQAAAESTAAFANMIAGRLGVKDAGALVASQTFQAIAGGVNADDTAQANAAKSVLDAYMTNVQAVVKSEDYAGRMIGFGSSTWVYYEQGLLNGAKSSGVFNEAISAAVVAFLISRGYGSSVVDAGRSGGSRP